MWGSSISRPQLKCGADLPVELPEERGGGNRQSPPGRRNPTGVAWRLGVGAILRRTVNLNKRNYLSGHVREPACLCGTANVWPPLSWLPFEGVSV